MSDIFDDLDSIFIEGTSSDEEIANFNEAELHEIMSEIDDLEKEFEAEEEVPMSLQEKIDAELSTGIDTSAPAPVAAAPEVSEMEEIEDPQASAEVLMFEKAIPRVAPVASTSSGVSFQANGQMSLSLDFMVGQDTAKLIIDPVKGLTVTLSGVELCIREDSGCTVVMDNGMKFTIPLSAQENSLKKKSA